MKVRQKVISKLDSNIGLGLVMITLNVSPNTARKLLAENSVDSDLTKASMVKAIAEQFGLPEDEILYNEKTEQDQLDKQSVVVG